MRLRLRAIRYNGALPGESLTWSCGAEGGMVGRDRDSDWVLSDQTVSRQHFRIDFAEGGFRVTDKSKYGLCINNSAALGPDNLERLQDRDILLVGAYEIRVEIEPELGFRGYDPDDVDDPFGLSSIEKPLVEAVLPAGHIGSYALALGELSPPALPGRDPGDEVFDSPVTPADYNPFDEKSIAPRTIEQPGRWSYESATPAQGDQRPPLADFNPTAAAKAKSLSAPPIATSADPELFEAFLAGANLSQERIGAARPELVLRAAGERLREFVGGIRALLATRAKIKNELRVEQTYLKAFNNNPLKFSFDDEQAILVLLGISATGQPTDSSHVTESFDDIQTHELTLLAGARQALQSVMTRLDPTRLEGQSTARPLLATMLPVARKAHLWDLFEAEFQRLRGDIEGDAHSPLARALSHAYESRDGQS